MIGKLGILENVIGTAGIDLKLLLTADDLRRGIDDIIDDLKNALDQLQTA